MYKGTLCVLVVLAIVLYSTNALPTTKTARKARQASDTDTLTDKFDSLINNLNEIKVHSQIKNALATYSSNVFNCIIFLCFASRKT